MHRSSGSILQPCFWEGFSLRVLEECSLGFPEGLIIGFLEGFLFGSLDRCSLGSLGFLENTLRNVVTWVINRCSPRSLDRLWETFSLGSLKGYHVGLGEIFTWVIRGFFTQDLGGIFVWVLGRTSTHITGRMSILIRMDLCLGSSMVLGLGFSDETSLR